MPQTAEIPVEDDEGGMEGDIRVLECWRKAEGCFVPKENSSSKRQFRTILLLRGKDILLNCYKLPN